MFTGIVEEVGTVESVFRVGDGVRVVIGADAVLADARLGASIAVDGCCLTVVDATATSWTADVQAESLRCTTLGELRPGSGVNLERPVRLGDRLGGHLVSGHVDGTGSIVDRRPERDGSVRLRIGASEPLLRYVVAKGSVAVDGVSLTVAQLCRDGFEVGCVPHTLVVTTLGRKHGGARVNLEVDLVAKYIERFVSLTEESIGHDASVTAGAGFAASQLAVPAAVRAPREEQRP